MSTNKMQGVFPILITPFDEKYRIDEESLRRVIEFNIEAGVHGLGVALGSEIFKLSEAERSLVTRIVVDQVKGRLPVVINSGAPATDLALLYSQMARDEGADALMVMPPNFMPASAEEIVDYFQALSQVGLPIFIQDVASAPVSPGLARRIAERCEWVQYIKVETPPVTAKVADMISQAGDVLTIFGGAGGGYFIEEMARGSLGTMPFCTQPEAFVAIWNHMRAGEVAAARSVFDTYLMPIGRIAGQGAGLFYPVHKEILRVRGVIRTNIVRRPASAMDKQTLQELHTILAQLYPDAEVS